MKALFSHISIVVLALIVSALPTAAHAQSSFEVSGWIPYWAIDKGTGAALKNIDSFTEINPFGYSVKTDGSIADTANLKKSDWKKLFAAADKNGVDIVPSIMWSDRANIGRVLANPQLRQAHVKEIADLVARNKFDGIDIDYENKAASTRPYFSLFLKELKAALGTKELSCTIEARTPPDSLYRTIPANLEYANDYKEINKYCDRVRIMAYDQQTADWKLNASANGPYAPLSDNAWVKKVIDLTAKDISKDKLMLGIPTYGHEYEVTVSPTGSFAYKKLWSFNPKYATDLAKKQKVTPTRAAYGEMSFSYIPKDSAAYKKTKLLVPPKNTPKGEVAIAEAIAYAKATGKPTTVNVLWWSDATAISDKINLAKASGLKGAAIFKIDGASDPGLWKVI